MTKIINHIFRNLTTRILVLFYIGFILITIIFLTIGYFSDLSLQKERQYDRLKGIVTSIAIQIDGDQHAAIFKSNRTSESIEAIKDDSNYYAIHQILEKSVGANNLTSPMYTLVMNPADSVFCYGVRSDQFGGTRHKKYMQKHFKTFLRSIKDHNGEDLLKLIDKEFNDWRGENEQIDDVCVMGIQI